MKFIVVSGNTHFHIDIDISKAYTSIDTDAHGKTTKQANSQIARPSHKTQTA